MMETFPDNHPQPLQFGVTLQSIVPMRREPHEQSEMVSQLLFGEYYQVEEVLEKWLKIVTCFDEYRGWIDRKIFKEISESDYCKSNNFQPTVLASKLAEVELPDSTFLMISAGSSLPGYDEVRKILVTQDLEMRIRSLTGEIILPPSQKVAQTALQFRNVPYLWGGRSFFGMDCSGFVQLVFKIHGIALPRDTSKQVTMGEPIIGSDMTIPGDLAFFGRDRETITHVGLVIAPGEIIHCSGWVRIDNLEKKGILDRSSRIYTHKLQALRRIHETIK
jgi:gamma-D-glutamyl-L-lysine dipeptidyl-peptidase